MKKTIDGAALLALFTVLTGAAIRVGPMFHDFWLDEAWSLLIVRDHVQQPVHVLTRLHTDNNHPLNSFWLFLAGDRLAWPVYRIPAFVAGILCIPLSGLVMRRFGRPHALITMILVACSYPLIVYSTEARGYGLMLMFVLLAVECIARRLEAGGAGVCFLFWIAVILGFLSHLTFLHAYAAVVAFSVSVLRRRESDREGIFREFLLCHGVPVLFLVAFYGFFVRHIQVAGAEPGSLGSTLIETTAMTLGLPDRDLMGLTAVMLVSVLLFQALRLLRSTNTGWDWLFFSGIVFFPLVLGAVSRYFSGHVPLFPRYFLTSVLLFLLLFGFMLGEFFRRGRRTRVIAGLLLSGVVAGNLIHAARFTAIGRGEYKRALSFMLTQSPSPSIHVRGNSDFRTQVLLEFYSRYLPRDRKIWYYPQRQMEKRADWWIVETLKVDAAPTEEWTIRSQHFRLKESFTFFGPSGCGWALYERTRDKWPAEISK